MRVYYVRNLTRRLMTVIAFPIAICDNDNDDDDDDELKKETARRIVMEEYVGNIKAHR